jgi:hypothetical protein
VSIIPDIADAVVTALNGHQFSETFAAVRAYRPEYDLRELADLRVTVVPKSIEMTTAGRGLAQSDIQIDLAVQKKLSANSSGDNAEIDALMGLVQEIAEFIRSTGRFSDAVWGKTENSPIYAPEHLGEMRLFTSVLTLTLRTIVA